MSKENINPSKHRLVNLVYYVSALLLPSILLFDLYNRNRIANNLFFEHVLLLAGILAIAGVLVLTAFWLNYWLNTMGN